MMIDLSKHVCCAIGFLGLLSPSAHGQAGFASLIQICLSTVSSRFVEAGLTRSLDYQQQVRECILGARVTGEGKTTVQMKAELVADPRRAAIQFNVLGRTDLETIGRQKQVTVWGKGVTRFNATKPVVFDKSGFDAGISTSRAQSNNWPCRISAPPLLKNFAWNRIERQRSEANCIVARRAEPMINQRIDQEVESIIQSANDVYQREFRDPLTQVGAFPRQLAISTSADDLKIVILQAADAQTGAPSPAPQPEVSQDIGIRCHETAFNNMAESLLAGKTLTDDQFRTQVGKYLTMASLQAFTPNTSEKPWAITFSKKKPVRVDFQDGGYKLVIAGERWKSGRRSYRAKMNVSVIYQIDLSNDQVRLVRSKDLLIAPPGFVSGKNRLTPTALSLRRVLQRKFEQLFPPVIYPDKLVVPGPWKQAGPLRVTRISAVAGWLQMSWAIRSLLSDGLADGN